MTLQLNQDDYLEVIAVAEIGDGTKLSSGTALTVAGESVFSVAAVNTGPNTAARTTFQKCQVKHNPTPVYPSCPEGFTSIHNYAQAIIKSGWTKENGVLFTHVGGIMAFGSINDSSWSYKDHYSPHSEETRSTLACAICAEDLD